MDRKNFFRTAGRLMLLGGISGSVVYLFAKNKVDMECTVSASCRNCARITTCDLPQAAKVNRSDVKTGLREYKSGQKQ